MEKFPIKSPTQGHMSAIKSHHLPPLGETPFVQVVGLIGTPLRLEDVPHVDLLGVPAQKSIM